jgi:Uma2 family endonuclease
MLQTSSQPVTFEEDLPPAIPLYIPHDLTLKVSHEDFVKLAAANRDLRLERTAQGELIVNPPTGWETGKRNMGISGELYLWCRNAGKPGEIFDSSTAFTLPNGAIRSPDASWISQSKADTLSNEQKQTFANVCPDFVVELRSRSDSLKTLQEKMREYMDNGARLGWTRKNLLRATAVPASFVHDIMNDSRSKRQVVILDCCFSGAFAE